MNCPQCHKKLYKQTLDGLEVDHCHACGGTFFDAGELNRVIPSDLEHLMTQKTNSLYANKQFMCPKDNTPLQKTTHSGVPHDISLAYCAKCRGIFSYPEQVASMGTVDSATHKSYNSTIISSLPIIVCILGVLAILTGLSIGLLL